MMHMRHVQLEDDGDDQQGGPSRSPRNVSRRLKQPIKKDPLKGSLHSENTTGTSSKQKRRNSIQSQKSLGSRSSQENNKGNNDDFQGGGSTQQQLHGSIQQFHGSTLFSGSSVASRQSYMSTGESNPPGTPIASGASRGSAGGGGGHRRKSSSVTMTPISSALSSSIKESPLSKSSSRRSNPQTPPGGTASPMMKKKLKKKTADESGATERSSSTRTSFISSTDSEYRHQQQSSDDGESGPSSSSVRKSPVKKRRPKVSEGAPGVAAPMSPMRKSTNVVMAPQSPQVNPSSSSSQQQQHFSSDSPVAASPGGTKVTAGRRVVKKKIVRPKKPGDPESPRKTGPRSLSDARGSNGGGGGYDNDNNFHDDVFYTAAEIEKNLTSDDEEFQMAPLPRQTPKPTRRTSRKPTSKNGTQPTTPMQHSKAHVSQSQIPDTPMEQREVPAQIGRTPHRSVSALSSSDDDVRGVPSRKSSFETHFTQSSNISGNAATTKLYEHARRCQWDEVMIEVEKNPRDAKTVGEKDGTTALHLAVMSRTNPMMRDGRVGEFKPAPLELIEMLVKACPETAGMRCSRKRYTPLAYACLVADHGYDMDDCSEMVLILLKHAPGSVFVFTDDGFSAVDIHILSYSQIHKQKEEVYSGGRTSSVVLRTLLAEQPDLAESRVYKHKVRGPIELLYRCNTSEFQDAMIDDLTGEANDVKKKQLKSRFGSVASVLSDWWAWKWVLLLLKFSTIKDKKPGTIFSAVQAAARLVACPLPILALAINTFPHQVEERDPRGDIYNLPLHEVCSWRADEAIISGDPFVAGRKLKAIQLLLNEYPEASRMTNNMGETPLQLAVETCTAWHGGLELLVESCPKALKFPRKLRMGDQGLCLSVLNPSALDSVASYDSDEQDPMAAMEGMYPFALAAVLGGVAANKRRIPLDYTEAQKQQHLQQLVQKDLQAVRSVYGLLRSRPDVLEKYRKDVTRDYLKMLKEQEDD